MDAARMGAYAWGPCVRQWRGDCWPPGEAPGLGGPRGRGGPGGRPTVAGVLLAAGAGSRLGRPKALVELGGQTLAERGVQLLRAGGAAPILVVTGAVPLTPVISLTPVQLDQIRTVYNERWRTGMGSSLCAALLALTETGPSEVGAVVVALADQPLAGADAVARLIAAYRDGAGVAVAAYDGRPRNPVLLAREH